MLTDCQNECVRVRLCIWFEEKIVLECNDSAFMAIIKYILENKILISLKIETNGK